MLPLKENKVKNIMAYNVRFLKLKTRSHHQRHMVSSESFRIWAGETAQRLRALAVIHAENQSSLFSPQNPVIPAPEDALPSSGLSQVPMLRKTQTHYL